MNPNALQKRLASAFKRMKATDGRTVYKAFVRRTGGDPLIGRPQRASKTLRLLEPQPTVYTPRAKDSLLLQGTTVVSTTDLVLDVVATALSREEIANKDLVLVFKNEKTGATEEYTVVDFVPNVLGGMDISFSVVVRSRKRS